MISADNMQKDTKFNSPTHTRNLSFDISCYLFKPRYTY